MSSQTDSIILDLNSSLFERNKTRLSSDFNEEIEKLKKIREKQKNWNYQRGVLVRKYNKMIEDPNVNPVKKQILEREINTTPKYKLENIDNEISRLEKEDYIITLKWKGGDYQVLSSELLNKENPALFILEQIKESKMTMDFGRNEENKIKLIKAVDYNIRAVQEGAYENPDPNEYPIFFEFVGDYIIIKI